MVWTTRHEAVSIGGDVTRTKIERVGGHLLIGDAAIPIASMIVEPTSVSDPYSIEVSDSGRGSICKMSHWTAREVLEVAYGGGEWLHHPKPTDETRALVDEIESQRETIRSLHTELDDLTRTCMKAERAKDEEIAVLREALRRVLKHYIYEARKGDGILEDARDDVAAATVLAKAKGPRFEESAIARGLASIREAAKAGR